MSRLVLSSLLVTLSFPGVSSAGDAADLLLRNGVFYPVVPAVRLVGTLAVRGGRIAYLGPDAGAAALRGVETEVIELAGRTVIPGLIDAHSHLAGLGRSLEEVNLVGAASLDEVVERVAARAGERPAGSWIMGRGWDQNDWPDTEFPTHEELSRAVPEHPVWLKRIDGHAALLNQRAMDLLGIGPATGDPPGGRVLKDASGRPTGVLVDAAMGAFAGRLPEPGPEDRRRQILAAADHCVALGLTTVTEMGVEEATIAAYEALRRADELPLRVAIFLTDDPLLLSRWFERGPQSDPEARLLVRGVKLYADGALGSRGAALVEPYADDPGNVGLLVSGSDHLAAVCRRAAAAGFLVGIHAIGDRGNLVTLDALERCFGRPRPELRFRVEHAQVMRPQDIARLARLGVIASMQPTHATSDMPWADERLGDGNQAEPGRLAGAYAWRSVLEAGGRLALGSDFPVESADPRLGLYAAVTRQDLAGDPPGGWLPDQRLTREEALRGFTLDAAWSLFLDEEIGSLEVGKRADLVVLAKDLMAVPAEGIPGVPVDLTIVEGRVVHRREAVP